MESGSRGEFFTQVESNWVWSASKTWAEVEPRSLDVPFRSESLPSSQGSSQRPHDPTIILTLGVRRWGWSSGSEFHNLTLKSGGPNLEEVAGYCHGCQEKGGLVEKNPYLLAHWRAKPTGFILTHPIWNPYSYWKTLSCRSTKDIITVAKEEGKISTLQDGTF